MSEALPAAIVTQVEALGHALVAVAATCHDGTLATVETATLEAIRAATATSPRAPGRLVNDARGSGTAAALLEVRDEGRGSRGSGET